MKKNLRNLALLSCLMAGVTLLNACGLFSKGELSFEDTLKKGRTDIYFPLTEQIDLNFIKIDDLGNEKRNHWLMQYDFYDELAQSAQDLSSYYEKTEEHERSIMLTKNGEAVFQKVEGAEKHYFEKKGEGAYQELSSLEAKAWSSLDVYAFLEPMRSELKAEEIPSHIERKAFLYSSATKGAQNFKKELNALLPEAFDEVYLPYFDYALKVEFEKDSFDEEKIFLSGLQIKVTEKDTGKLFYQLDWKKTDNTIRPHSVGSTAVGMSVGDAVSVAQTAPVIDESAIKEEKKNKFLEKIENNYQNFLNMNAYDTTSKTAYRLKADQQILEAVVETNGSEFYKDRTFMHYIGRESTQKAEGTTVNLLAISADKSYEHKLQSETKEEPKESEETNASAPKESAETPAWLPIEPKLSAQYYEKLLSIVKENIELFEIEEKEEEKQSILRYEGDAKIFFALSKEVLGIDLDYFKVADVQGTVELIFDENYQSFSSLQLEVKSVHNDVLHTQGARYFQKFRTGDYLNWPVSE